MFLGFCTLGSSEVRGSALRRVDVYKWMTDKQSFGGVLELEVSSSRQMIVDEGVCRRSDHSLRLIICFVKEPG